MRKQMDEKVRDVAKAHGVPVNLLMEAIALERDKVVLKKRRLVPKLVELVEAHASRQGQSGPGGSASGD